MGIPTFGWVFQKVKISTSRNKETSMRENFQCEINCGHTIMYTKNVTICNATRLAGCATVLYNDDTRSHRCLMDPKKSKLNRSWYLKTRMKRPGTPQFDQKRPFAQTKPRCSTVLEYLPTCAPKMAQM